MWNRDTSSILITPMNNSIKTVLYTYTQYSIGVNEPFPTNQLVAIQKMKDLVLSRVWSHDLWDTNPTVTTELSRPVDFN